MRRTKDASQQTRRIIIDAARGEFARRGVTRTTLEQIARAAGVTRGAIYWHFANKQELFDAMREQVSVPLIDSVDLVPGTRQGLESLAAIEAFLHRLVDAVLTDRATRETFTILHLKCEYVDELEHDLARQGRRFGEFLDKLAACYAAAREAGTLRADLDPELAALESCAFAVGLVRLLILARPRSGLRARIHPLISAHIAGRRATN